MARPRDRLRIERFNVELGYHATWTFLGVRGILGERWAHGPTFGAFTELGTTQVNLTPAPDAGDQKIVAAAGLRAAGLLAEGEHWTHAAPAIGRDWLRDVLAVLKPQVTVTAKVEVFALYPVRDPARASRALRSRYYTETLEGLFAEGRPYHAAVEGFVPQDDQTPEYSFVIGIVGPPHRGQFFTFPDDQRDRKWWMGIRTTHRVMSEGGIADPAASVENLLQLGPANMKELATTALQPLRAEF